MERWQHLLHTWTQPRIIHSHTSAEINLSIPSLLRHRKNVIIRHRQSHPFIDSGGEWGSCDWKGVRRKLLIRGEGLLRLKQTLELPNHPLYTCYQLPGFENWAIKWLIRGWDIFPKQIESWLRRSALYYFILSLLLIEDLYSCRSNRGF